MDGGARSPSLWNYSLPLAILTHSFLFFLSHSCAQKALNLPMLYLRRSACSLFALQLLFPLRSGVALEAFRRRSRAERGLDIWRNPSPLSLASQITAYLLSANRFTAQPDIYSLLRVQYYARTSLPTGL